MANGRVIGAADFKAQCLRLLEEVSEAGTELTITKRGKPVARVVPVSTNRSSLRGAWKALGSIRGDIVHTDWTEEFDAAK